MNKVYVGSHSIYILGAANEGLFLSRAELKEGAPIGGRCVGLGWGWTDMEATCTLPELHAALLLLKEKKDEATTLSPIPW